MLPGKEGYTRNQAGDAAVAAPISRIQCIAWVLPHKLLSPLNRNACELRPGPLQRGTRENEFCRVRCADQTSEKTLTMGLVRTADAT